MFDSAKLLFLASCLIFYGNVYRHYLRSQFPKFFLTEGEASVTMLHHSVSPVTLVDPQTDERVSLIFTLDTGAGRSWVLKSHSPSWLVAAAEKSELLFNVGYFNLSVSGKTVEDCVATVSLSDKNHVGISPAFGVVEGGEPPSGSGLLGLSPKSWYFQHMVKRSMGFATRPSRTGLRLIRTGHLDVDADLSRLDSRCADENFTKFPVDSWGSSDRWATRVQVSSATTGQVLVHEALVLWDTGSPRTVIRESLFREIQTIKGDLILRSPNGGGVSFAFDQVLVYRASSSMTMPLMKGVYEVMKAENFPEEPRLVMILGRDFFDALYVVFHKDPLEITVCSSYGYLRPKRGGIRAVSAANAGAWKAPSPVPVAVSHGNQWLLAVQVDGVLRSCALDFTRHSTAIRTHADKQSETESQFSIDALHWHQVPLRTADGADCVLGLGPASDWFWAAGVGRLGIVGGDVKLGHRVDEEAQTIAFRVASDGDLWEFEGLFALDFPDEPTYSLKSTQIAWIPNMDACTVSESVAELFPQTGPVEGVNLVVTHVVVAHGNLEETLVVDMKLFWDESAARWRTHDDIDAGIIFGGAEFGRIFALTLTRDLLTGVSHVEISSAPYRVDVIDVISPSL